MGSRRGPYLTPAVVAEIERRAAAGETVIAIAAALGLSRTAVRTRAKTFRDRTGTPLPGMPAARILSADEIAYIQRSALTGRSTQDIAAALRVSRSTVQEHRAAAGVAPLRRTQLTTWQHAELQRLAGERMTAQEIAEAVGCGEKTAQIHRRRILDEMGDGAPRCRCGKRIGHLSQCAQIDDDAIDAIERELRAGKPIIQIAREQGLSATAVSIRGRRIIAELRAAGRTCGCGRLIWHDGFCRRWRVLPPDNVSRRVRRHFLTGGSIRSAVKEFGVQRWAAKRDLGRILRSDDAKVRRAAIAQRSANAAGGSAARGDDLYAAIGRHVPRTLPPALRDDVISDIYLAVASGTLARSAIAASARRFVSAGYSQWADGFRSRSIDAPLYDDSDRTLGDTFADGTSLVLFEEAEFVRR